jgi:Rho-binding antiterminator
MDTSYHPISCDYHDLLETLATVGRPAEVSFRDGEGVLQARRTAITDVYSRGGAEYLVLGTGETVRLDRLIALDGALMGNP